MSRPEDTTTILPESKIIHLRHGRLSYREAGGGRPIVFLHGMNGGARSWARQFISLASRYRVIAWDAPGFGDTDPCDATVESYAAVAIDFMRHLGAAGAVLVGHSMGGVVAGRVAATSGDLIVKLILSCTHCGYGHAAGGDLMPKYSSRIEELKTMPKEEYGRLRASKMVPPETSPEIVELLAKASMDSRPEGLAAAGRMVQEADNAKILSSVAVPTLILYSRNDPVIRWESTSALMAALPAARVEVFASAGHAPYAEEPERYNRLIDEFAAT